jgi:predicted dehydrogenase
MTAMQRCRLLLLLTVGWVTMLFSDAPADDRSTDKPLRGGMIGLDSSHVIAFTKIFNSDDAPEETAGVRIVAGYPGGTDIPASRDRVGRFTQQLQEMGIEIVASIPELLKRVDVVLLESVDGRIHLEEARQVIAAGKPVFIDKPIAGSLIEAIMIFEMAERAGVPCFSSSSIRFGDELLAARTNPEIGGVVGCDVWGSCTYQEGLPDLFFYGIHGVEGLYTAMGTGCQTVTRTHTEDTDLVVGTWEGGRIGTYRGIRNNKSGFGIVIFGKEAIREVESGGYDELCREIARFFKSGTPPVPAEDTIEIAAFMEAADKSRDHGGAAVSVPDLIREARAQAEHRLAAEP